MKEKFEKLGLKPYGAVPSERQMQWYRREATAFFHFGVNTFSDLEWGNGTEKEAWFNPTELDCRQWIRVIKEAGFTAAILTAKHHDGFCLWPSKYSEHTVAQSPYKDGKGDVVREFVDACREYQVKPGLYLSPWDRNSEYWGSDEYNTYYNNQLTELMTEYGEICECWWDGAGSTEANYDWGRWAYTVRTYQPQCIIFGSLGATEYVEARWVGNESGYAGNPCWATIDASSLLVENTSELNVGKPDGNRFIPAEVDVSIRPGWFYHKEQDHAVKSPQNLVKYWFESSGRNAGILLNFPPDRRGIIHEIDETNVLEASRILRQTFAVNQLVGAKVTATTMRDQSCSPDKLLLKDNELFYASAEGDLNPVIIFKTKKEIEFDCLVVSEVIELGHRVRGYKIEAKVNNEWLCLVENECIGFRWAERFDSVRTNEVRLTITSAVAEPVLRSFGVYKMEEAKTEEIASTTSPMNLMELSTTQVIISGNILEIEFGGIFPFDTLEICPKEVKQYNFFIFNGTQYKAICSGEQNESTQIQEFEKQEGSYKVKLVIEPQDGLNLADIKSGLGIKIYNKNH